MNYKELGLKVGLEIHQQLEGKKLFCDCPSELIDDEPDKVIERKLRAVAGETGEVDVAAKQAQMRDRAYIYNFYDDSCCLLELDEEPPQEMDEEALETVLEVALMLNSNVVDEIYVMRKTVVDGSNTSGFQRTALVAMDGALNYKGAEISIPTICIEEDSARIVEEKKNEVTYDLDRLGIPLIEIATGPDIRTPEEAKDVAEAIGSIIRATGKSKRGIGTIRQDLNISIENGARVEIKGVQELNSIPDAVKNEIERQKSLLEIKDDLKIKDAPEVDSEYRDISDIFKETSSKVVKNALEEGGIVGAMKLEKFSGVLGTEVQPGRRFGTELSDYAKSRGAEGLFHSDELPAYGITEEEVERVEKELEIEEDDAFILIADREETCENSFEAVADRANTAMERAPEETRKALPEGTSSYMRPLAGRARMYPETDLDPILKGDDYLSDLEENLPKHPWEEVTALRDEYGLSKSMAEKLYDSPYHSLFKDIVSEMEVEPKLVASTFTNTVPSLSEEVMLQEKQYFDLFNSLEEEKFSKEAIPEILERWVQEPEKDLPVITDELDLSSASEEDVEKIVENIVQEKKDFIREKGDRAVKPLMGLAMKKLRGRADGEVVMKILKKKIEKFK